MRIREVRRRDLYHITNLWYELARMHESIMNGYDLSTQAKKEWHEMMEDNLTRDNYITFVAEDGNEIIGFASATLRRRASFFRIQTMGVIMDIYVKESRRGEGIGSELVEAAEDWIRSKGVRLAVVTVAPENSLGGDFWSGRGYETYLLRQRKEL